MILYTFSKKKIVFMCGNQISSTISPADPGFKDTLLKQLATGRIIINNYALKIHEAAAFRTVNTHNIRQIQLENCKINHQILQQLLIADLSKLRRLNLNKNQIGPIGCRVIAETSTLPNIDSLQLNQNKIKDAGVQNLVFGNIEKLNDLSLAQNELTNASVEKLKGKIQNIECLNLGDNNLTDECISNLTQLNTPQLLYLRISRNEISDKGLKDLLGRRQNLSKLQFIMADRNKIVGKPEDYVSEKEMFLFF